MDKKPKNAGMYGINLTQQLLNHSQYSVKGGNVPKDQTWTPTFKLSLKELKIWKVAHRYFMVTLLSSLSASFF